MLAAGELQWFSIELDDPAGTRLRLAPGLDPTCEVLTEFDVVMLLRG